jgi:hypothetical protein
LRNFIVNDDRFTKTGSGQTHRESAQKRVSSAFTYSDHIALLKAYDGYQAAGGYGSRSQYAYRNFLSENTLRLMGEMRQQFRELLADAGADADTSLVLFCMYVRKIEHLPRQTRDKHSEKVKTILRFCRLPRLA